MGMWSYLIEFPLKIEWDHECRHSANKVPRKKCYLNVSYHMSCGTSYPKQTWAQLPQSLWESYNQGVGWAAVSSEGLTEGWSACKLTHVADGKILSPVGGCWLEVFLRSLICGFLHGAPSWVSKQGGKRRPARQRTRSFCDLISGVILHHFCHLLFVRRKSLSLGHIQEDRVIQRCGYQEVQVIWGHFRSCLPSFQYYYC